MDEMEQAEHNEEIELLNSEIRELEKKLEKAESDATTYYNIIQEIKAITKYI